MPKRILHTFLYYDEDNLPKLVEYLTASHYFALISPLHDADRWTETDIRRYIAHQEKRYGIKIDPKGDHWDRPSGRYVVVNDRRRQLTEPVPIPEVGDLKKPHRHVIVKYDVSMPREQVAKAFNDSGFDILYFEEVIKERSCIRYLCHIDNPEKFRYKRADVISLGGYDIQPLYDEIRQDKDKNTRDLLEYIERHPKISSFKHLVWSLQRDGQLDLVFEVKRSSFFWNKMIFDTKSSGAPATKEDATLMVSKADPTVEPEEFDPTVIES